MGHVIGDRIKESAAAPGTGTVTLGGAATGFRSFQSVMATSDTTWYCITDGVAWEVGLGTLAGVSTLARTSVISSSNTNALVNFSNTVQVFITEPASQIVGKAIPNIFAKNQSVASVTVASASGTYTPDASTSNNFQFTLTGNLTLANPTNLTAGMVLNFCLDEDATGGRTITLGNLFKWPGGVGPTWLLSANAKNFFSGFYDGSVIRCGAGVGYA